MYNYLFVVVEHSIHVLNPDSIHWAIENEPLAIWSLGRGEGPVGHGQDAVRPLVRDGVKGAIELAHGDGLGVENGDDDLLFIIQPLQ